MDFNHWPEVNLVNVFAQPIGNAVAAARTCYSSKIVTTDDVLKDPERMQRISNDVFAGGHHTVFQHATYQFALSRVSRHLLWSVFHDHPYYNSEQQSQRFVRVRPENVIRPVFATPQLGLAYSEVVKIQMDAYEDLTAMLTPIVSERYFGIFPGRQKNAADYAGEVRKKAQEVARYVLPIGTYANVYHTVSLVTLLRYHQMAAQSEVRHEAKLVIDQMMAKVIQHDPAVASLLTKPLEVDEQTENLYELGDLMTHRNVRRSFDYQFKASGRKHSVLIDFKSNQTRVMAAAVRTILCNPDLTDQHAIEMVMNANLNPALAGALNVTTLDRLSKVMSLASYTFQKRLSHTADSQNQRHRMTPGVRPEVLPYMCSFPDYITPSLIEDDPACKRLYDSTMENVWQRMSKMAAQGALSREVIYLVPNAFPIRFMESADLLNLHHKMKMRLCYNAQEEIWNASVEEVQQIQRIDPMIAAHLAAPCVLRSKAGVTPKCPEGKRFCGIPVWDKEVDEYERVL